jgi:hypothetical protein
MAFVNVGFRGGNHIWTKVLFPFKWLKLNHRILGICQVDWRNIRIGFQTILLFCNWVVGNYKGSNAMVKCYEYGFILVNFEHLIPLLAQSFAFPMHVQQVFFCK